MKRNPLIHRRLAAARLPVMLFFLAALLAFAGTARAQDGRLLKLETADDSRG